MMAGDDFQSRASDPGQAVEVFKPMMGNIIAGFILSMLLIIGGAAAVGFPLRGAYLAGWNLPLEAKQGWCWLAVGLGCFLGAVLLGCGAGLAVYSRWLAAHRVEVHANGFRYCSRQSAEDVPWAQVRRIRETILYERPPILKGPAKLLIPKVASTSYTVVTATDKEYGFDGNSVKAIGRLGGILRKVADRLSLSWETVEEHA